MQNFRTPISRRAALVRGGALLAGAATIFVARPARAKAKKSDMQYQDSPRDGKKCAGCKHYTPNAAGAGSGTCAMVEGTVSAEGWCQAFVARN